MNMDTKPHPRRYKLQWLSEGEEVQVKQLAEVSFSTGKHKDKILWCGSHEGQPYSIGKTVVV